MIGLRELLDPLTKREFLDRYWENRHAYVHREDPNYFSRLITGDDLDKFLTAVHAVHDGIEAVSASESPPAVNILGPGGQIDVSKIAYFFKEGGTIIFSGLQKYHPPLGLLCSQMESDLNHRFQTNIYVTPPHSQGFISHYDTHDVFILQISGEKKWRIYHSGSDLPLPEQGFDSARHSKGEIIEEFSLQAGDVAYIPRGLVHDAIATGSTSIHVTLGAMVTTWGQAIERTIKKMSLEHRAFRVALQPGYVLQHTDAIDSVAAQHIKTLLNDQKFWIDVVSYAAEDFVISRAPRTIGRAICQPEKYCANGHYLKPPEVLAYCKYEGETIVVTTYGRKIIFPMHTASAVQRALSGELFTPKGLPGDLDQDGKAVLVTRLLDERLVCRV